MLNLEWSSAGRDRETASLICNTLRRRGHTVVEDSVFRYRAALARHRPRLLYLADPRGAAINHQAALFARSRGFPIVTVTAEGDFRPEVIHEMFWGHVTGRELIEDLNLQWSARARDLALEVEPALAPRLRVAGGVGFDRYRLYRFASAADWMAKYALRFERMVGYASWSFDRLDRSDPGARAYLDSVGPAAVERLRRDRDGVRDALARLIADNPDTLFLLKEHPGVVASEHTEFAGLGERRNAMVVRDEEPIADCIAACDVWMAYESTTCLEAWLLGKPTLLVNPTGRDFERADIHRGSPAFRDAGEVQAALDSWYGGSGLPGFDERADARREIAEGTIQWDDGRNHLRAAHYIEQLLARTPQGPRLAGLDLARAATQGALFRAAGVAPRLPLVRAYAPARARFSADQLAEVTRRCAAALERFDPAHELGEADLAELERLNPAASYA